MTFIDTVPEDDAREDVAEMYETDRAAMGHLPNFTRAFSHRPAVYAAWRTLNVSIKSTMELRRYELATVAAARRLGSSYCSLAHGSILAERFLGADGVAALADDPASAGLDEVDRAVMALAEKVAADAGSVTQDDIDRLRTLGLTDAEVFDVIAAAAARCFFSTLLDALGVQPDAKYHTLDPALRDALTVGRPIADA